MGVICRNRRHFLLVKQLGSSMQVIINACSLFHHAVMSSLMSGTTKDPSNPSESSSTYCPESFLHKVEAKIDLL